jgi:hypothetical protein
MAIRNKKMNDALMGKKIEYGHHYAFLELAGIV